MLQIDYDGKSYDLEVEDMDTDQARAMERFGIPDLLTLEQGLSRGDISSLTVFYWLMLQQNGEPGARLERVKFKPMKFLKALGDAGKKAAKDDAPKKHQG